MKLKITSLLLFVLLSKFCFAQKTAIGTIISSKGKIVVLKCEALEPQFIKGDSCTISKDISGSKNPFGITITNGWLGVGKGVVEVINKNSITVKVVKETSEIIINGKKTEHFVVGKRMKLENK